MSTNLALRLSTVSHTLIARNRKVQTTDSTLSKLLVAGLILITVGIISTSLFWAWSNLQCTTLNYRLSQGQELKKQYLESEPQAAGGMLQPHLHSPPGKAGRNL